MESIGKQRSLTVMLLALLLTLAASNTLLIYQNLQMRATLSKIRPREQESLRVGDEVRSFSALGIDGNVVNVNYTGAGSKRLFLFLSPHCPYSREQFTHWKRIIENIDAKQFEVIGIVSASENKAEVEEYIRSNELRVPLRIAFAQQNVLSEYKLSGDVLQR